MYNNNSVRNMVKIGYQSTQKINQIITRYATACGNDIMVCMFKIDNYKKMEIDFKRKFQEFNVEREFYNAELFPKYFKWCITYTQSVPEIGDGKLVQAALKKSFNNKSCTAATRKPASASTIRRLIQFVKNN